MGGSGRLFWEDADSVGGTTDALDPSDRVVADADGLDEWLAHRLGDALRSVGLYDGVTLELVFVREDVAAAYSSRDAANIAQELGLASSLTDEYTETLYEAGGLDHVVYGFEDAEIVRVPLDGQRGIFFSVDSRATVEVPTLVEDLKATVHPTFR